MIKNIYIADDDIDDISIFEEVLEDQSSDVTISTASDGYDLFATMERNIPPRPDIIFLDLNMPKMNGHATLEQIKKDDRYKNIPVIIYSTSTEQSDMNLTYAAGADYFITKPPDFRRLGSILKQVFAINFKDGYQRPNRENFEIKG